MFESLLRCGAYLGRCGLIALLVGGCASLAPERGYVTWSLEKVSRPKTDATDEVRWTYIIAVRNGGRLPVTLYQDEVSLSWDGVSLSPRLDRTPHVVPGLSSIRLPYVTVFRRSEFESQRPGDPGRAANARLRTESMRIYHQFLGRYEGGGAIILNIDFVPEQAR